MDDLGQAEIHEQGSVVGRDLEVARLDIPVDDRWFPRVQVGQGIADLERPGQQAVLDDRPAALKDLAQIVALNVVHHQVLAFVFNHKVVGDAR